MYEVVVAGGVQVLTKLVGGLINLAVMWMVVRLVVDGEAWMEVVSLMLV